MCHRHPHGAAQPCRYQPPGYSLSQSSLSCRAVLTVCSGGDGKVEQGAGRAAGQPSSRPALSYPGAEIPEHAVQSRAVWSSTGFCWRSACFAERLQPDTRDVSGEWDPYPCPGHNLAHRYLPTEPVSMHQEVRQQPVAKRGGRKVQSAPLTRALTELFALTGVFKPA